MQNKGFVIFLTLIVTALCLYYLSFTFVSNRVQQDAIAYATNADGVIDLGKKQAYLDSVWSKPVYNLFGAEFTYKEVKDNELSRGLDLQGGMHVTLEVSPIDIVKGLSGNNKDSAFVKAIVKAQQRQKSSQERFSSLFFETYREDNPGARLAPLFASTNTRGRISLNDTDDQVIAVVEEEIERAIDRSYTILKNRIDQFGTSQPNIQRLPGTGRIQIEIPGADNPARVRKLLQGVARLEFWDVIDPNDINSSLMAINAALVKEQQGKQALAAKGTPAKAEEAVPVQADSISELEKQLQTASTTDSTTQGLDSLQNLGVSALFAKSTPAGTFRYDIKDTTEINRIFKRPEMKNLLPRNVGVYWGNKTDKDFGPEALQLYFLDQGRSGQPKITGEVINDARQDLDEYTRPAVSMTMNATGTRIWAKMTAEAASKTPRGRIAIVLDNAVYSAPSVNGEIPNGNSQISGNFTVEEAKDLANILKAGSLPAPTKIVEEAIIGPTLGEVARNQGLLSTAAGLMLVVLFMIAYYSRGGIVANIALLFNIFFILGILAQFNASLTLPGIAGIVLTIGMAVDANVLIFERIKEEMAHGRRLKDAIKVGYERAFWTIFDSNLTTLLTAFFLFVLGQGPIKGFAITLMIGIITSFFTAVYVSRVIVEWMTRKGDESKITFDTAISRVVKKRKHFEFVKNSRKAYIASSLFIVIGLSMLLVKGLNFGVDFKGGRAYVVSFSKPVVATDLKLRLSETFENAGTEVKNYGSNTIVKVTTAYKIDDDSDIADEEVKQRLIEGIQAITGKKYTDQATLVDDTNFAIPSSSKVVATVAEDIKNSAWEASLFSLVGIFIYILIRFRKWQYSAGAIVATLHDTLFVFAAFAIVGVLGVNFEIDQVFVAAILTIIGYSINDTVIIFDRIREYIGFGATHDREKIVNDAINDTLARTIITAGTTLLVVLVLLLFGGEVLRGFAFALFIGVLVGTYSSVFIAAPIVIDLDKEKEVKPKESRKVPATV
jgi:SecD/SecF fusion protein